jgi:ribonuclease H-related protein
MQSFFHNNPQIHVSFCKVEAHSGDDFNELADGLAKKAVGLQPNPIFFKTLKKYGIVNV